MKVELYCVIAVLMLLCVGHGHSVDVISVSLLNFNRLIAVDSDRLREGYRNIVTSKTSCRTLKCFSAFGGKVP